MIPENPERRAIIVSSSFNQISAYMTGLKKIGYQGIRKALGSEEAIKFLEEYRPNLILIDATRRSSVGLKWCKDIKESENYQLGMAIAGIYSHLSNGDLSKEFYSQGANGSIEESLVLNTSFLDRELERIIYDASLERKIVEEFKKSS